MTFCLRLTLLLSTFFQNGKGQPSNYTTITPKIITMKTNNSADQKSKIYILAKRKERKDPQTNMSNNVLAARW